MQLDVREAAALLNVPENTVYRWIQQDSLPARLVNGQYRLHRAELLEWATVRRVNVSPDLFRKLAPNDNPDLVRALKAGGIVYDVPGDDRETVLRAVIDRLPVPDGSDRESLLYLFMARETLGTTGVGGGIAIPHPRHPLILPVDGPLLQLCFLARPIDFAAPDREPVRILFVLVCPTVRAHLQMLARLACLIRDPAMRAALDRRAPAEEILAQVRRVQESLDRSPGQDGPRGSAGGD
jgi:PTS system nitrogen regulatory IIA component